MKDNSISHNTIIRIEGPKVTSKEDFLAIEEPMEIGITVLENTPPIVNKNISITMRTPSNNEDLALGFLFTEGIIYTPYQVEKFQYKDNKINVFLNASEPIDLTQIERHSYVSSSCGVCGKASIDSIRTTCRLDNVEDDIKVDKYLIKQFPTLLNKQQAVFESTGGLHAAALFNIQGELITLREDVGRHNALDKLIGWAFQNELLSASNYLLLLSGRASFELIQKAAMAGIKFIMAVGAPSSLAVELAKEFDITLIGFLNHKRYNIYCGEKRIVLD